MRQGRVAASAGALAVALAMPATAGAHATLKQTSPAVQSRVETSPTLVRLRFDQSVTSTERAIVVYGPHGDRVSGPARSSGRGRFVTAPVVRALTTGGYTVRWRVTSSDGHTGSGVFTFGVRVNAPPPTEAFGSEGPGWKDDLARWAYFVALALVIGSLAFRLIVLRGPLSVRATNRVHLVAFAGALAAINAGVITFVVRAANALQLPFIDLLYGDLSPFATKTRFGQAFIAMTLGYALVAGLVALSWIFEREILLVPALLLAVGFASGLSISGHSGTEPNSSVASRAADWLHLVAAGVWVGGLLTFLIVVWHAQPDARRSAFLGFSRVATVCVAILVVAGVYLSILRLPHVSDLWSTGYGQSLLLKLALVAAALTWGAVHHFFVRPRLERGESPSARIRRSLLGESMVAVAVLLAAAVLVNGSPPSVTTGANQASATSSAR